MEYNFMQIGKRIASERKNRGWSQTDLLDYLQEKCHVSAGRNTLSKIEHGKAAGFDLDLLTGLCTLFECDIGYLLCEYDEHRRTTADVCQATGLSEISVDRIKRMNDKGQIEAVNLLFQADAKNLREFLHCLWLCKYPKMTPFEKMFIDGAKAWSIFPKRIASMMFDEQGD